MDVGKVKIVKITEALGADDTGKQRREVIVQFNVGTHGPFNERFAASPFDPVAANTKLAEFARALQQLDSAM